MLPYEIQIQAQKFVAYFGKFQSTALADKFKRWAESKDFEPSNKRAIWIEVRKLLRRKSK